MLSTPRRDGLPAAYAGQLVQLVRRWNITAEALLAGTGLSEQDLQDPNGRVPLETFGGLVDRARTLTREPGLGFYHGLQKRVSMYGYLGFAAMSASTLREAIDLFVHFTPTLTTSIGLALHIEGGLASIVVQEHVDVGSTRDFALISIMVGMRQIGETLTGRELKGDCADVALPKPSYFDRFKHLLPRTRFNQPVSRVVFDAKYLELPLVQADRAALRLGQEHCERALDALGYEGDFLVRARSAIAESTKHGVAQLEDVASRLAISPRTLRRRLAEQGLTFSSLLGRERHETALLLLEKPKIPVAEIARRLGYGNYSAFARAFHRWTGETPTAYRDHSRAERSHNLERSHPS